MIPEYETSVHVRIPKEHREQLEKLIKSGKFKSISQIVRQSLNEFLQRHQNDRN